MPRALSGCKGELTKHEKDGGLTQARRPRGWAGLQLAERQRSAVRVSD